MVWTWEFTSSDGKKRGFNWGLVDSLFLCPFADCISCGLLEIQESRVNYLLPHAPLMLHFFIQERVRIHSRLLCY